MKMENSCANDVRKHIVRNVVKLSIGLLTEMSAFQCRKFFYFISFETKKIFFVLEFFFKKLASCNEFVVKYA